MFSEERLAKLCLFIFWPLLAITLVFIYWPSFTNFFFGDDFFNIILSRTSNFTGVINFFNLFKAPANFPFYRPLTTQFYFWLGERMFAINPFPYHVVNFILFFITIMLAFILVKELTNNNLLIYLTVFFYAFSSSHFYRLFFIAQIQEIGLGVFYLACVILYVKFLKNKNFIFYLGSVFFLILSLTAKETAIILPAILITSDFLLLSHLKGDSIFSWFKNRFKWLIPFIIVVGGYLILRIFFFGFSRGNEYQFVLQPKSVVNNTLWYLLWSLGIPESFVNIKIWHPQFFLNPGFFTKFGDLGALTSLLFIIFFITLLMGIKFFFANFRQRIRDRKYKLVVFAVFWFLLTILPVAFFPFHKFSYSTTIPLFGVSLILSLIASEIFHFSKTYFFLALGFYILANSTAINLAFKTHWSIQRAKIAQNLYYYLKQNYPTLPEGKKVYFYDYDYCINEPKSPKYSLELDQVMVGDKGLLMFYNKPVINVLYQYKDDIYDMKLDDLISIPAKCFTANL